MITANRRTEELDEELTKAVSRHRVIGNFYRNSSLLLMVIAVFCSVGATIAGIGYGNGHLAGSLSLVPPLLAFAAVNLKLDARAKWYRRKEHSLAALLRRLRFEMPDPASPDQIALISRERSVLEIDLLEEFEAKCTLGWGNIVGHRD